MTSRLKYLILICLLLGLLAFFGGSTISRSLTFHFLKLQKTPSELAVYEILEASEDPSGYIQALWNTGRIPHRHMALHYLKEQVSQNSQLYASNRMLILDSLRDVDFSNRELALGMLSQMEPEEVFHPLLVQLTRDKDQAARLLALRYVVDSEDSRWISLLLSMLEDPDPMIAATAASKLRHWTGQDFGVRMQMAIVQKSGDLSSSQGPRQISEEQWTALQSGVQSWKQWATTRPEIDQTLWMQRSNAVAMKPLVLPLEISDIVLTTMDNESLVLSKMKGKAVLLNFWTTWCASCMTEIPDLNWLHDQYPDSLQVIGISLDGDDGHGHEHASIVDMEEARKMGLEAVEQAYQDQGHSHDQLHRDHQPHSGIDLKRTEKKIQRAIQKKHIQYPVVMDPQAEIGQLFHGQELPTNVLIDTEGRIRRRFVGTRPIQSWVDMLEEIGLSKPIGMKTAK